VCVTIVWGFWHHRNNIIFRNLRVDAKKVFTQAQVKPWTRTTNRYLSAKFSYSDWCMSPLMSVKSIWH